MQEKPPRQLTETEVIDALRELQFLGLILTGKEGLSRKAMSKPGQKKDACVL